MKEVEVVIKMPEKIFRRIQALARNGYFEHDICGNSMRRIAIGMPLPEGHGDLVDKKALCDYFGDNRSKLYTYKDLQIAIEKVDAIIKADKKGELEENLKEPETIIEADAPKKRKGIPLEENDSGYNCENWIP